MSVQLAAMMLAVRNKIRADVIPASSSFSSANSASCELTDNGRPTVPYRGIAFFAVHGGSRRNLASQEENFYTDEVYNFKITISIKSADKPRYRFGDIAIDSLEYGLTRLTDLVVVALNGYVGLTLDANQLMTDNGFSGHQPFIQGTRPIFLGADEAQEKTSSWFSAKLTDQGAPMGVASELRFQGLRLIRPIGQS